MNIDITQLAEDELIDDILLFFKKFATEKKTGYQTLLNNVLREYVKKTSKKCA